MRRGDNGTEVRALQELLQRAGFAVGVVDGDFGPVTDAAVRAFQSKHGLTVDGVVGPATLNQLHQVLLEADAGITLDVVDTFAEATALPALLPQDAVDRRMSEAIKLMQTCDGGQGLRYGGWYEPHQYDGNWFRDGSTFPIPLVGKIVPGNKLVKPIHGGTCSPFAGMFLSWWFCANQDFTRILAWNATYLVDCKTSGETVHDGERTAFCRGFEEHVEVEGVRRLEKLPLNVLYSKWRWLNRLNIIIYSSHVVFVLKVGGPDGFHLEDPQRPGQPVPSGLYRMGADGFYPDVDGEKYYSGTKQTFRRLTQSEVVAKPWDVWRVEELDLNTASPRTGRYAGRAPWPLVLSQR